MKFKQKKRKCEENKLWRSNSFNLYLYFNIKKEPKELHDEKVDLTMELFSNFTVKSKELAIINQTKLKFYLKILS